MVLIVVVMGTTVYILEDNNKSGFTSIPRSIYWAIVTVTTVGYGDIHPESVAGQAVASVMMISGYAILAVPTGIAAAQYSLQQGAPPPRNKSGCVCAGCKSDSHDDDAVYCKYCGMGLCEEPSIMVASFQCGNGASRY